MDISFNTNQGKFNFRVGAIIIHENQVLMVKHDGDDFYYSVGGRVKMNETTEEAVVRELYEETGQHFKIERLGFIHENLFTYKRTGERFTEIGLFYYMKPSKEITKINQTFKEYNALGEDLGLSEHLVWIPINELDKANIYLMFFKTELLNQSEFIKHFATRTN